MRRKLIEVALPLDAINAEAAREKSIRHGHPSTLHLWWARRPLAACRAVLFTSLIDDPDEPEAPEAYLRALDKLPGTGDRREKLFRFIGELVKWENSNDEQILGTARRLIRLCTDDNPPPIIDPFCGGGSIPLEAQRLGLECYASDLNPVAVLITKALVEIPPRFANLPPVHPTGSAGFQPALGVNGRAGSPPARSGCAGKDACAPGKDACAPEKSAPRGWYSRGYLPHFDGGAVTQTLTFRTADSLPAERLEQWGRELSHLGEAGAQRELRERIEAYLDAGAGELPLADPRAARIVQDALLHFDGERYRLHAWVVMPNHVHLLLTPIEGHSLAQITHSLKSYTAHRINHVLGRHGEFWQRESFDRYIRDAHHFAAAREYIEANPVKAGLCGKSEEWEFSSASFVEGQAVQAGSLRSQGRLIAGEWKGAQGLAEDVRYYGRWMRDEAERRIGHLYPKGPKGETVIAWLWARTVKCPNPACGAQMPLVTSFKLSTKRGKEAWVEPRIDAEARTVEFRVRTGKGNVPDPPKTGRGAKFRCLVCESQAPDDHIKAEGVAGRMGTQLMAVVAEGSGGRRYLSPADWAAPDSLPQVDVSDLEAKLNYDKRAIWCPLYGLTRYVDLFTDRQLVALTTFSDLVGEAREQVLADALATGMADHGRGLEDGGTGAQAYADAVATYLAFAVDKGASYWSSLCTWHSGRDTMQGVFGRQALPMVWDYAEANPFSDSTGNWSSHMMWIGKVLDESLGDARGYVAQLDATVALPCDLPAMVSTDPPYYDNIGYADLSDFFYVWLRRSLGLIHPTLFSTLLSPKEQELVATPHRFDGDRDAASDFFENGLRTAFGLMREAQADDRVMTVFYALKQSEHDETNGNTASTGWETMLEGLLRVGLAITATWPMRTEMAARALSRSGTNTLASSIVLVCRPRSENAPMATRREFTAALRAELPAALAELQQSNIAPVDLAQASIGPGMAVFSRYSKVLEADGSPVTVRTALQIINQELDAYLAQQEGDLDRDTRFCVDWFTQYGLGEGEFGQADVLARAKNTSVEGLTRAGVLEARRGKVRLLGKDELAEDWDPVADGRMTVWEATHHLIRALDTGGEEAAARLVARLGGGHSEAARALAYRLYSICDRKARAELARDYNNLVVSWPAIRDKAASAGTGEQARLIE
jgi:putative DNA methylase